MIFLLGGGGENVFLQLFVFLHSLGKLVATVVANSVLVVLPN